MNIRKILALVLAVAMLLSLGAATAFAEETYSSTAKGFGGDVTVTLGVEDGVITSLTAEGPNESTDYGAKGIVYFNKLFADYVGTAAADFDPSAIDGYTGASTTTKAVFTALGGAFAALGENAGEAALADGSYEVLEWGFSLDTQLPVTVEIKDGAIAAVTVDIDSSGETPQIGGTAVELMVPRILAEQSLAVDAISGATSTSNAIKRGIADALQQAMAAAGMDEQSALAAMSGWYAAPSYLKTDADPIDVTTQVLVVGGGGTGCLAALQSQKTGADTLVIETSAKYGGTGALTCGPMTINPPAQVEEFGNRDLVDADMLYNQWLDDIDAQEGDKSAAIISNFMDMSGYDIDWMNSMGFEKFAFSTPFKFPAYQIWCTYPGWNAGKVHGAGLTHGYFNDLMDTYTALGGKTMFETTGTGLLLDDAGKVIGVEAVGYDGQVYHIYADAVVIATGGYAGSAEYLKEFTLSDDTGVYQTYGVMTNVGTAITMARQVDGKIADNVDIVMAHFSAPEKRIHEFTPADNQIPTAIIVSPYVLDVNTNGDRFINELTASDDAGDETNRYFSIIGSDQLDAIKESGFVGSTSGMYLNPGRINPGEPVENLYTVLDFCVKAGFVWKSDNLDDLAASIAADTGMTMSNLADSVARYNELCAAGEDSDFGKAPMYLQPITGETYYAVEASPILYSTSSSVEVDESMRLVTNDGGVIDNVFVGGLDSIGVVLKDEYIDYGGVAQSWAFYSGRLAGMNAAEVALQPETVAEGEGYVITAVGDKVYNVTGVAPSVPENVLLNGDAAENGLNYISLALPVEGEASTAIIASIAPCAGDGPTLEPGTKAAVEDGVLRYALQVNDKTITAGGVKLTADFDNGESAVYVIQTDFLTLADAVGEDVTAAAVEAAAADEALADIPALDIGTTVCKAAADEDTAIYLLGGTVAANRAVTEALGLDAEGGEHYAVVLLDAPEGFAEGSFTVESAVSYAGNEMPVARSVMPAVNGGAVFVQQFLPATYAYAGFFGGENLVSPGTLSEKGVTLTGTWDNGAETKAVTYKLGFDGLYMDFAPVYMNDALAAAGVEESAEIVACGVNAYKVSNTGTVNVLLSAPDPFFTYSAVTVNGEMLDSSAGYVVVPMELASGENTITAVWTGTPTMWGPGADYPVTYTFICD